MESSRFPKYVFCCGTYRSGSTWSFNVVRRFAQIKNLSIVQMANSDIPIAKDGEIVIAKFHHDPSPQALELLGKPQTAAIVTVRDPRYSVCSLIEVFGFSFSEALQFCKKSLDFADSLPPSKLVIRYADIDSHPLRLWKTTYRLLCYTYGKTSLFQALVVAAANTKTAMRRRANKLDPESPQAVNIGFSHYSNETFLHRGHIRPRRTKITPEAFDLRRIDEECSASYQSLMNFALTRNSDRHFR
jgi:hypothetical protein